MGSISNICGAELMPDREMGLVVAEMTVNEYLFQHSCCSILATRVACLSHLPNPIWSGVKGAKKGLLSHKVYTTLACKNFLLGHYHCPAWGGGSCTFSQVKEGSKLQGRLGPAWSLPLGKAALKGTLHLLTDNEREEIWRQTQTIIITAIVCALRVQRREGALQPLAGNRGGRRPEGRAKSQQPLPSSPLWASLQRRDPIPHHRWQRRAETQRHNT